MSKFAFCLVSFSPLRREASDPAEMVSQLLFGEPVEIIEIQDNWTQIQTTLDGYTGWVDTKHLLTLTEKEYRRWHDKMEVQSEKSFMIKAPWGTQPSWAGSFIDYSEDNSFHIGKQRFDIITSGKTILEDTPFKTAKNFLNTPYLWGGKSYLGIDCSGLTQIVFRLHDLNLPRDAYQQADNGIEVDFDDIQEGDLAFFNNKEGKITHVGILDGQGKIIHASGMVRIDDFTEEGIIHLENRNLTHNLHSIKRL